eukprot:1670066-Alexandrium_andersonii.AAC.1
MPPRQIQTPTDPVNMHAGGQVLSVTHSVAGLSPTSTVQHVPDAAPMTPNGHPKIRADADASTERRHL